MTIRQELIQNIIEEIQGTCCSLDEICQRYDLYEEDLTMEELEEIDQEVFCCTSCGWWYQTGEGLGSCPDGDHYCDHCSEDYEDEED